jgi:hypothetical protein
MIDTVSSGILPEGIMSELSFISLSKSKAQVKAACFADTSLLAANIIVFYFHYNNSRRSMQGITAYPLENAD